MNNEIVELEFKGHRKEHAANPQQFPFVCGDPAIVSTDRGHDLGIVSYCGTRNEAEDQSAENLTIIRKATSTDVEKLTQNRIREHEAKQTAKKKINEHHLEMKLVDVESQWDGKKLTFYFTADGRIDFRELVKDLASTFRTRIDLRQIGARDETRKSGGFGVCGEPLCCSTHLSEFKPITTQMPRDQFLPLNPTKLSGICGRLKCCLRYELDGYREFQKNCPKVGHPTKDKFKGEGFIDKIDVIRETIHIRYVNGSFEQVSQSEFLEISDWKQQKPKNECICTCSKSGASDEAAPPLTAEEIDERSVASTGDRVTIGEKGMSFEREEDGSSVSVQTDVNAKIIPAKKKKRRNRKRKSSAANTETPRTEAKSSPKQQAKTQEKQTKPRPKTQKPVQQVQPTQPKPPAPPAKEAPPSDSPPKKKKRRRGGRRSNKPIKE